MRTRVGVGAHVNMGTPGRPVRALAEALGSAQGRRGKCSSQPGKVTGHSGGASRAHGRTERRTDGRTHDTTAPSGLYLPVSASNRSHRSTSPHAPHTPALPSTNHAQARSQAVAPMSSRHRGYRGATAYSRPRLSPGQVPLPSALGT